MRTKASFTGSSVLPLEKARDFAGFCFPRLVEMKAQHRPSAAGLRVPATALCCKDLLSLCNLPANAHGCDVLLYPSEVTMPKVIGGGYAMGPLVS